MASQSQWKAPKDYRSRPVAILGGGVLGRRIAACWISGGYDVVVRDPSDIQCAECVEYVHQNASLFPAAKEGRQQLGNITIQQDLATAVQNAFLVIECVPEKLPLKIDTFAELERLARSDAVMVTNSSSYKSSEMISKVSNAAKTRILNSHYLMPPGVMFVELMSDGHTDQAIIDFLCDRQREVGTTPYVARKESTGFIINRLWAAVKRETLTILAEGVSVPREIDELWDQLFVKGGTPPCRAMDGVGLDTVAFIESHYVEERGLSPSKTVNFLQDHYLSKGKLGLKSAKGGLYPREPRLLVLDVGLAAANISNTSGSVLEISPDGKGRAKTLIDCQALPDGIDVDPEEGRIFWTNMGLPGTGAGELYSALLDGSDVRCILPKGTVNTPKQLVVESRSKKIYFCDREGLRVLRCNYDGTYLEILIQNGDWHVDGFVDATRWCVGIAVSPDLGKFYWTQKGPSKGNQGRIFCASIEMPAGQTASNRTDVAVLFDHLPEPVDLEIDSSTGTLYWSDRGELPLGNSVNRAKLDEGTGLASNGRSVIVRHLHEAIGLKLDAEAGHLYITDLGGSLYRCNLDGTGKEVVYSSDDRALTGITLI